MPMKTKPEKIYTLRIPRPQYDRLGSAFDLDDTYFDKLLDDDHVVFHVSENQRKKFSTYAKSNTTHLYWITQMFLPRNITKYEYTEETK